MTFLLLLSILLDRNTAIIDIHDYYYSIFFYSILFKCFLVSIFNMMYLISSRQTLCSALNKGNIKWKDFHEHFSAYNACLICHYHFEIVFSM